MGFVGESGHHGSVPFGPDYLNAALTFITNPTPETLAADVDAFQRLYAHVDRIGKML